MQQDQQQLFEISGGEPAESLVGIDEVGRGPLAGPVVAAAVILPADHGITELDDSKKISEDRREAIAEKIRKMAVSWCVASASVREIDRVNILGASMLAMTRAANGLSVAPGLALVDGNRLPALPCTGHAVVKGDQRFECIAAASILAKVERDRLMRKLDLRYPGYDWASNKGYPTRAHMSALETLGVTREHRQSFAPVKRALGVS